MLILLISNRKNLLFLCKFVLPVHSVSNILCISYMLYTYNLNIIEYIMGVTCNYMYYIFKLYVSVIFKLYIYIQFQKILKEVGRSVKAACFFN